MEVTVIDAAEDDAKSTSYSMSVWDLQASEKWMRKQATETIPFVIQNVVPRELTNAS